ncbi:nucleotide exchange factor GrpE [Curtobacterium sp. L1-20]|uniref:nucleotide exchange factor GrpE n=1 Tax=Curtobacterium sp. L1-20 TaxID=3138181 RepID=UPI003B52FE64
MTDPKDNVPEDGEPQVEGDATNAAEPEDLVEAEGPDVEVPTDGPAAGGPAADAANDLSPEDEALLADAARAMKEDEHRAEDKLSTEDRDLVAEMRADMLRAQAELVNFRKRVERDREANREVAIAEVVRALLPALDDLTRAEAHGDLTEGPMQVIGQKIRGGFERFKLVQIGEKGESFDPNIHEAIVQLPTPGATGQTVADVVEPGYKLGERVLRAAKVAVAVPA